MSMTEKVVKKIPGFPCLGRMAIDGKKGADSPMQRRVKKATIEGGRLWS